MSMKYARKSLLVALLVALLSLALVAHAQNEEVIEIGDTVSGTLDEITPRATYIFEGTEGTTLSILLMADFDAYLVLQDDVGSILAEDDDGADTGLDSLIVTTLPYTGEYTIIATSLRNWTSDGEFFASGDYTLSLTEGGEPQVVEPEVVEPEVVEPEVVEPEVQEEPNVIELGGSVDSELTNSAFTEEWTFEAEAGTLVTITMVSEDFDCYLLLLDSDGVEIAYDDDSAGNLDSRIGPLSLSETGTYTVVANSYGNVVLGSFETGRYSLTLAVAEVEPIEYSEDVDGTIDSETPNAVYSFSGEEGDFVTLQLDTPSFSVYAIWNGPDGLFNQQTYGGSATLGPVVLPTTGDYVVTVGSYDLFTPGDYTLSLARIVPDRIEYGDEIDTEFGDEGALYYTFEGETGDAISISVSTEGTVDTRISVTDPNGLEIASDDDSGAGFDPEIPSLILTDDGTYSILIRPYIRGDNGEISFTLNDGALPSLDDGAQIVRLSDKLFRQTVVFEGEAGQSYLLTARVLTETNSEPRITVTQDGQQLAGNSIGFVTRLSIEFEVPEDGTVEVTVEDFNYSSSIIEFSVEPAPVEEEAGTTP
jgi:serine protease Do